MREELVRKVKSRGYWQFVFHPVEFEECRMGKAECYDAIQRNNVTLRGWDYPHVEPRGRTDGNGNAEMFEDGFESWTDWADAIEFWRYYRSGQFVHLRALREDWPEEHSKVIHKFTQKLADGLGATYDEPSIQESPFPERPRIEYVGAIYEIAEAFEFWRKTVSDLPEVYDTGFVALVGLGKSKNRRLVDSDFLRGRSLGEPLSRDSFEVSRSYSATDVVTDSVNQTVELIVSFFDEFGYAAKREQILSEVEQYLSGVRR